MATLTTGATLIVAGGLGVNGVLSIVEVMNTETLQWSTAADLPQPRYKSSATAATCSTCVSFYGQLLAISGKDSRKTHHNCLHVQSNHQLLGDS